MLRGLLAAFIVIVTPFLAAAQEKAPATRLSGVVLDTSGAVISGATVDVLGGGAAAQEARSDKNGLFTVTGLPAGEYRLVVSKPDFLPSELSARIPSTGAPALLRIVLAVSAVKTIVEVQGREDDLIGIADSGSQGTVGARELQDRPILRSGELLETVPGLIITQHAGGGKANQYFLRGFNLDHGTDFAIFIDDMPLNLPSHAHGEGYSDMNAVIPEFVRRINFEKGPYDAEVGNFGSAGSAHIETFRTLPRNFFKVEGGMYGYGRAVFGASRKLGPGYLLVGGEESYDNGPWTHPDAYNKLNGLLTYSRGDDAGGAAVTARAYHGKWNSSDQLPVGAVPLVGVFGTLNPTDGGRSQRYSVQPEWHRQGAYSASKVSAYLVYYDLDLFSDFTYYLTDYKKGDQFEQQDRRWVAGVDARHSFFSQWFGRKVENTVGLQVRNDWIGNGLYRTENRLRVSKTDYFATGTSLPTCPPPTSRSCPILPATTERDNFTDTLTGFYGESKIQLAEKVRSVTALRGDFEYFNVTSLAYSPSINAANSGTADKFLPSPKQSLVFGPWANTEVYLQGGFSYHSNDGRGATQTVQTVSPDNPYPNTPVAKIPPLIPTKGAEFGLRSLLVPHLQSTLSLWYLHSASELQQDGDTGTTVASRQPSDRYGVEWANYYTPLEHLAVDFDLADSKALFTTTDANDAAPQSPGGRRVPEAVGLVLASGISVHDYGGFSSSLRLRYFGPRDLTSDGIYRSQATALLNGELGYEIHEKWRLSAEFLNMLNRRDHDIDYAYTSQVTPTAAPAFTDVFHPVEPFQVRFSLGRSF